MTGDRAERAIINKNTNFTADKMAGGGGGMKMKVINFVLNKPAVVYLGGASVLYAARTYQTRTTYNYWFGQIEFNRKLERNQL